MRIRGFRFEFELIRRRGTPVTIQGVTYEVAEQVGQALEVERRAHTRELAARGGVPPAELEAARAGECEARELLAAAEAKAARLEADLAAEVARRDEYLDEAIRIGVAAASADVELVGDALSWGGPVGRA